jgi:hypothetical protein
MEQRSDCVSRYDAAAIATASGEVLIAVGSGGIASVLTVTPTMEAALEKPVG